MSHWELERPVNRSVYDLELRKIEDSLPYVNMNPRGPTEKDNNNNNSNNNNKNNNSLISTKRTEIGARDCDHPVIEQEPMALQDPTRDINWTYRDRSDYGQWGLFASKDIKPGEVVIKRNRPSVSVPDTPKLEETCSNCFLWEPDSEIGSRGDDKRQMKLRACTGCRVVKYCGKKCQSQSWKEVHKFECKTYNSLLPGILPNNIRLLVRLFLSKNVGAVDEQSSEASLFQRLESHVGDFKKTGGKTWEQLCLSAKMVQKASGTSADEDFVIEALARIFINLMTVVTPTYDPVGICLDTVIAGLNHACDYNSVVSFDGPSAFVRSLRKINRGEEVTISYIDATNPFAMRQAQLKERYFFTCTCGLCKKIRDTPFDKLLPGVHEKNMGRVRQQENEGFQILEVVTKSKDAEENVRDLERGMECLRATMAFPLYRQPYASIRQQLIGAYLSTQRWASALAHALKQYFFVDPQLFPQPFHPVRVVHTWALITLINYIRTGGTEDEATKRLERYNIKWEVVLLILIQEVTENVGKSHGDSGQFAAVLKRKMIELKGDDKPDIKIPEDIAQDQWSRLRAIIVDLAPT